jgi:hypothetical protein
MPYKSPQRQRAAKAEHARRKRAARVEPKRGTLAPLLSGQLRLSTARDVLTLLESQVEAVLADEELGTAERARLIVQLAGTALRAIEACDLAGRLEALERAAGLRRVAPRVDRPRRELDLIAAELGGDVFVTEARAPQHPGPALQGLNFLVEGIPLSRAP